VAGNQAAVSPELEHIAASYARLSYDIGSRINFACDVGSEEAFAAAEREQALLDQAFFVLCFAALERQVVLLASARRPDRRQRMRDVNFNQKLKVALKVAREVLDATPSWSTAESIIGTWYQIRNDIAHGDAPAQLIDVPAVLRQADAVANTLAEVRQALGHRSQ
jgi:hypothetical protein